MLDLFLRLLERDALTEGGVVFHDLYFALHFLPVLAAKVDVVGLRRLQLYELILRHASTLPREKSARK